MSQPSETSGRPLDLPLDQHQPNEQSVHQPTPPHTTIPRNSSSSSSSSSPNTVRGLKKTAKPRRRPGHSKEASPGPHAGSSRCEQRSTSPANMSSHSPVNYTRTGRISKAKKGLKVHKCENCGKVSYSSVIVSNAMLTSIVIHSRRTPKVCLFRTRLQSTLTRPLGDTRRTTLQAESLSASSQTVTKCFIDPISCNVIKSDSKSSSRSHSRRF